MNRKTAIVNLAARILAGEYDGDVTEAQVRNQVIRVFKGADIEALEGRALTLVQTDVATSGSTSATEQPAPATARRSRRREA